MYDLISIGSATLDIVVKSSDFLLKKIDSDNFLCLGYGEKMDVEAIRMISGGGATNVAVGASRLGLKTMAICEVGKDFAAQLIFADLKKDKVDTAHIIAERMEETAVSILLTYEDGGRSALTHRGAAYQLESRDIPWKELARTRWLHLGTLGGHKGLIFDLFDFAKQHELAVSWTPSIKDLDLFGRKQLLLSTLYCEALVMNDTEWESIRDLQQELLNTVQTIVITKGDAGGTVFSGSKKLLDFEAIKVKVVEETGAGDGFTSGFISGIITGKSLQESVEWGKKNAASVIQYLGAKEGLLTKSRILS